MNVTIIKNISRKIKEFDEYEKVFSIPDSVGNDEKNILKYLKDNNLLEDEDDWEDTIGGQDIISDDKVEFYLGEIPKQAKGNCRNCDTCKCDKKANNTKLIRVQNDSEDMMNVIITKVVTRMDNKSAANFLKEFSIPANVGSGEEKILKYLQDNNFLADNSGWDIYDDADPVIYPGDKVDYYLEEIRED